MGRRTRARRDRGRLHTRDRDIQGRDRRAPGRRDRPPHALDDGRQHRQRCRDALRPPCDLRDHAGNVAVGGDRPRLLDLHDRPLGDASAQAVPAVHPTSNSDQADLVFGFRRLPVGLSRFGDPARRTGADAGLPHRALRRHGLWWGDHALPRAGRRRGLRRRHWRHPPRRLRDDGGARLLRLRRRRAVLLLRRQPIGASPRPGLRLGVRDAPRARCAQRARGPAARRDPVRGDAAAARGRGQARAGRQAGGGRPADGGHRARLQQPARRDHGQCRAGAGIRSARRSGAGPARRRARRDAARRRP